MKFRDEWEASLTKPTSKKAVKQKKEKETKAKGSEKSSDQKGPKTVDQKFERLKTLPADYYFCFKDFTWAAQKKNLQPLRFSGLRSGSKEDHMGPPMQESMTPWE